MLKTCF